MDFYIFHREPVGLLGVFFGLGFFRCNQVSVAFGFIFGTNIFQSSVVLDLTQFWVFGYDFGIVLFSWYFGFILGLSRFSL
jgi:hypothetical protein